MKATYLNSKHKDLGGFMVDFSGWEMPLHYGSQLNEHNEVRTNVGIFDVSHMAVFDLDGKKQEDFLRFLLPNDIKKINGQNKAMYSPMLNHEGGILDDLIVYYLGNKSFRIVSNCATREKNLSWLSKIAEPFDVGVDFKSDYSILALQGPNSYKFIKSHIEKDISKFNLKGEIGIGHVRWATHGKPSKVNAHPHSSEQVSVVHNGIIENSTILKKLLEKKGYIFKSQTDTEVIAHLVTDYLKKNSLKDTTVSYTHLTLPTKRIV